jgi:hypothetical protein
MSTYVNTNASIMMLGTVVPSPADAGLNPDDKGYMRLPAEIVPRAVFPLVNFWYSTLE